MKTGTARLLGKTLCLMALCLMSMVTLAGSASAAGFSGSYDPENWSLAINGGDGWVDTYGAPSYIELYGSNYSDCCSGSWVNTDYTAAVHGTGYVEFDWRYTTPDIAGYDPFGYLVNGVFTALGESDGEYGWESIAVTQGDYFGFRMASIDDCCGAAMARISKFEYTGPKVPEPNAALLLGVGLGVIGHGARRGRRA